MDGYARSMGTSWHPTPVTPSAETCEEASDISWRRRPSVLERAHFLH